MSLITDEDVKRITEKLHDAGLIHSCLTCQHFQEEREVCGLAQARPPARTIAYGCDSWQDTLPF